MGNCCSSRKGRSEREAGGGRREGNDASDQPNERTRLLGGSRETRNDLESGQGMSPEDAAIYHQQKEQEKLKKIVQTTAESLIDISSIRLLDRILQEQAAERANAYQAAIKKIPEPSKPATPAQKSTLSAANILELLDKPSPTSEADIEFARVSLARIKEAIKDIRIQDVGELVVHLKI